MDCSMSGFPVLHQLLELAQTHIHRISDAIQQSHSLSSPSSPAFTLSQHQVFSNESVLHIRWPKYRSFSFRISPSNEYSGLILSLFFFFLLKKKKSIYLAALDLSCLMWVLVPWPGIEPRVTAMEAWSLNHWTTREAPVKLYLVWCSLSKAKEGRYSSMTVFIYYYLPMINLENKVAKWQPKQFYILDSFTQVWNIWPVVNYPRFDWKLSCRKLSCTWCGWLNKHKMYFLSRKNSEKEKKQRPKMFVNEPALCLGRRLGGQPPAASNGTPAPPPPYQAEEASPTWIPTRALYCSTLRVSFSWVLTLSIFWSCLLKYKSPWEGCHWNWELTPT